MTDVDVSNLSLNGLRLLKRHCETLIESCQADLSEYELYIQCQTELVRRGASGRGALPALARGRAPLASAQR